MTIPYRLQASGLVPGQTYEVTVGYDITKGSKHAIDFLTSFIASLRPDIIIERFISESPPHLLIAPQWGLKNFEMVEKVNNRLIEKQTWQGKNYKGI